MAATLKCDTIQNASSATANLTLDASGNATVGNTLAMGSSFKRNRIINGNFAVDQRNAGAAQTISAGTVPYTADRWMVYSAGSSLTSQRVGSVGAYSIQLTGNTGNTSTQLIQRIEAINIADLAGQTVTLSFTISSSSLTTVGAYVVTPTAVDNYSVTNTAVLFGAPTVTSTPTRFSYPITMPSTATNGAQIFFQTGAFTSGTLTVTNVQLEVGSVATPYERQIYSDQLAQCQRYYQRTDALITTGSTTTTVIAIVSLNPTMRTTPSVSATAAIKISDNVGADFTQSSASVSLVNGTRATASGANCSLPNFTGLTTYRPYQSVPNETGFLAFSAEL